MQTRTKNTPECYNVLIIGAKKAGKTTLFDQLSSKCKPDDVDEAEASYNKSINRAVSQITDTDNNDTRIDIIYHDINSSRFQTQAYQNPKVILAVFDITDSESLKLTQLRANHTYTQHEQYNPICIYVGAKSDLSDQSQLSDEEIISKIGNDTVFIVSAQNDTNIDELLSMINSQIIAAERHRIAENNRRIAEENTRIANLPKTKINNFMSKSENESLNLQLYRFLEQTDTLQQKEHSKTGLITECQQAVLHALESESSYQKQQALANLHKIASSLSNTKQLKALAICMMAIGTVLAIVGALTIAVSMGAITTGVLAPLGVLGLGGGAAMTALGAASIIGGATLFAARHTKKCSPIDSAFKIEKLLK